MSRLRVHLIAALVNGAAFTTLSWTGFSTSTRQYEATRIATTNTSRIARAAFMTRANSG